MYYPIHHYDPGKYSKEYVGQAAPSSSAAQPSDPLAGVPPDEALAGGIILASRATLGMFLGGILLYSLNPQLGIPRWLITLLGGVGGLMLGTYAGMQGAIAAMPSLGVQPSPTDLFNLTGPAWPTPSSSTPADVPVQPSSSSPSTIAT